MTVTSLQLHGKELYFVDSTANQAWRCDTDMRVCKDLHVNKIFSPSLLAIHRDTSAGAEHVVYADDVYNCLYTMPIAPANTRGSAPTSGSVGAHTGQQPVLLKEAPPEAMSNAADLLAVGTDGDGLLLWRAGHSTSHVHLLCL